MEQDTNDIRRKRRSDHGIDDTDRKLLALLTEDSAQSYAELSKKVHLSAPAVHERVKRLKASQVISRNTVTLDGPKLGRPFLAFVHVNLTGLGERDKFVQLAEHSDVEEVHSVAGDSCLLIKVRCTDAAALEDFLARTRELGEVTTTRSYVVLNTYLERGVQAILD
ncbi:Lrp/AsnC family transcriptional regulator [Parasphingorhabdus sp.]|jgi:DNA-binding Lrp family transcriptional regulator|uniref:Lrp/AsnC family transcriptional regulator n=1 Tax=Parasphingorhabdus sp. TaxID=2709688 RepID=UPI0007F4CFA8|nr:hypothetical protein A8B75_07580 [Sphingomonadales bacterium EhC05]